MKSMKNIKPAYAVQLGKGVFAGTTYIFQCKKCGLSINNGSSQSAPIGQCPKGGSHDWTKTAC